MKKISIILLYIFFTISIYAQNEWNGYIRYAVASSVLFEGNFIFDPHETLDLGLTYECIDLIGGIEYTSTNGDDNCISLNFKTKFDILKAFNPTTKHALKLGIGTGVGITIYEDWGLLPGSMGANDSPKNLLYSQHSLFLDYEYNIYKKIWIGTYTQAYMGPGFIGGIMSLGVSGRINFK